MHPGAVGGVGGLGVWRRGLQGRGREAGASLTHRLPAGGASSPSGLPLGA